MSASSELIRVAREWAATLRWQTSDPEDDGPSLNDLRSAREIETLAHALEAVEKQRDEAMRIGQTALALASASPPVPKEQP